MNKTLDFLGIDLGASSGRGIVGSFDGEKLSLREVHRFPNEPQMLNGRFTWDILRLFAESKNAQGGSDNGGYLPAQSNAAPVEAGAGFINIPEGIEELPFN